MESSEVIKPWPFFALFVCLAFVAAACGSDATNSSGGQRDIISIGGDASNSRNNDSRSNTDSSESIERDSVATDGDTGLAREDIDGGETCPKSDGPCRDAAQVDACEGDCGSESRAEKVLKLVNKARSQQRECGDKGTFEPALALRLNQTLNEAAELHVKDLASNEFLSHTGSDGSDAGDRLDRVGYEWSYYGENIAFGHDNADSVVKGWLESPGHCTNIMDPNFTQMGVAFRKDAADGGKTHFWVQVFGTPR